MFKQERNEVYQKKKKIYQQTKTVSQSQSNVEKLGLYVKRIKNDKREKKHTHTNSTHIKGYKTMQNINVKI